MRLKELRMDWRAAATIVVSTLVLVVDRYHHVSAGLAVALDRLGSMFSWLAPVIQPGRDLVASTAYDADGIIMYLAVPLLVILIVYRQSPARYGFRLGDWRAGLLLTVLSCVGMTLVMAIIGRTSGFRSYYAPHAKELAPLVLHNAVSLLGWEFLFRGFLLFGLLPVCGPYAIILQAVPFTIAHFGKPELETLSCIFGGSAFGYIAWRTRSFLYPFLVHWYLTTITVVFAAGGLR